MLLAYANKKDLDTTINSVAELQQFHFKYKYAIETLFLLIWNLSLLLTFLLVTWYFSLSPSDILDWYKNIILNSKVVQAFKVITFLTGVAPFAILLLYIKYSRGFYRKTIGKHIANQGEKHYQKILKEQSSE